MMKSYKLFFSLLIIVTACNCYIYLNRDAYAYTRQSSYFELYPLITNPAIKSLETINDSTLALRLLNPSSELTWFVKRNNDEAIITQQTEPTVVLQQGIANYKIYSNSLPDTISIKAEYYPINYFNKKGNQQSGGIVIYKTNFTIPYPGNIEKWSDNKIALTAEEEKAVAIILKDSMRINETESSFQKIKKISDFLYRNIYTSRGLPTDSMMALGAFQQYMAASAGQAIWCGNYAQIFNLFAGAAHIQNRYIESRQSFGNIGGGVHVFNEYWLAEKNKWAAIDIMFNNVAYVDASGNFLNAVEVKNAQPANGGISVLQSSAGDSLVSKPLAQLETDFFNVYNHAKKLYYYYNINFNQVYSFSEKIRRYVSSTGWFEVYADDAIVNNRSFYIKQLLIVVQILLLLGLIFNLLLNFLSKKNKFKIKNLNSINRT